MEDSPCPKFRAYDSHVRTHYLCRYLEGEPFGPVLDLGCSKAPFAPVLKGLGYHDLWGVDLLKNQLRIAESRGVKTFQKDARDLPFLWQDYFPIIIFTDVLVHLMNTIHQHQVFCEIRRVLAPDGCLIMTAPGPRAVGFKAFTTGEPNWIKSDYCTYFTPDEVKELAHPLRLERHDTFGFYHYVRGSQRSARFMFCLDMLGNKLAQDFGMVHFYKFRKWDGS